MQLSSSPSGFLQWSSVPTAQYLAAWSLKDLLWDLVKPLWAKACGEQIGYLFIPRRLVIASFDLHLFFCSLVIFPISLDCINAACSLVLAISFASPWPFINLVGLHHHRRYLDLGEPITPLAICFRLTQHIFDFNVRHKSNDLGLQNVYYKRLQGLYQSIGLPASPW